MSVKYNIKRVEVEIGVVADYAPQYDNGHTINIVKKTKYEYQVLRNGKVVKTYASKAAAKRYIKKVSNV